MSTIKDWLVAIGVVGLFVIAAYAFWLTAIMLAILTTLWIVKTVIGASRKYKQT